VSFRLDPELALIRGWKAELFNTQREWLFIAANWSDRRGAHRAQSLPVKVHRGYSLLSS
jgi:hypothetical protein